MFDFNVTQLRALKSKLEGDLAAVNRLLAKNEDEDSRRVRGLLNQAPVSSTPVTTVSDKGHVTAGEIKQAILSTVAPFRAGDIIVALKSQFPDRTIPKGAVSTAIFRLKEAGSLKPSDKESKPPKYVLTP